MPDTSPKSKKPGDSPVPLHLYLSRRMDEREDLTNVEVARRLGYAKPNVIAMMRSGSMKVPLSKVKTLAKLLELDAVGLLQRVLMEYDPALWETLEDLLEGKVITQNELNLVQALRSLTRGLDPALARNETFMTGFKLLVSQALDEQVMQELADHGSPLARRVSEVAKVNVALEEMCVRQANERRALRKRLLDSGGAGTGADS